jgi:L-fucose isomerase-like protein
MLMNPKMSFNDIDANVRGEVEKSYGTCVGRLKESPMTYARIATNDLAGTMIAYIGEGELTDDPLDTFGGVGVAHIDKLQTLLKFMCKNGFEHHVAISLSSVADILYEAMETYLRWNVYYHCEC